jgi:hypothetical protein
MNGRSASRLLDFIVLRPVEAQPMRCDLLMGTRDQSWTIAIAFCASCNKAEGAALGT